MKVRVTAGVVDRVLPDVAHSMLPPVLQAEFIDAPADVVLGATYDGTAFAAPVDAEAFNKIKAAAKTSIDATAEKTRLKYITAGAGQGETYRLKEEEARAFIAAGRPADTTPYPILTAEAAAIGDTVSALADLVLATLAQWMPLAAAVEASRRKGKVAVDACTAVDGSNPTDVEIAAVDSAAAAALSELALI